MPVDWRIINTNKREYLDPMQKAVTNVVYFNSGNTKEHELKKAEICYELLCEGRTFICEAKLKNGRRPDILVLDLINPLAYEVMKSEKEDSIIEKSDAYMGIKIVKVKC